MHRLGHDAIVHRVFLTHSMQEVVHHHVFSAGSLLKDLYVYPFQETGKKEKYYYSSMYVP